MNMRVNSSTTKMRAVARKAAQAMCRKGHEASRRDDGQAISEYLVILGVIVVACVLLAVSFQAELSALWGNVTTSMGSI